MAIRPRFRKTVFENGLTLLTERHSEFRCVSMGIWVKAGTRHERPVEAGCSHFLEHMLFKGTETRSALEIARSVDQVGGEFNAFTSREYTCFHILMLERDLSLGLEILGDVVLNSDFDPEELELERKVILQEISMVEESPEELVHDIYYEQIYGKHSLGKPILGTSTSIRRMRRSDLLRFFRRHYRPEEMIVAVAGDVSHDAIRRRLKPLLKPRWPGREPGKRGTGRPALAAPRLRPGEWWIRRPSEQVHLLWGVEGPRYGSRDRIEAYLLTNHLGGGMSSTLFQEIREKNGLAYTVYSNLSPFTDSGVFSIYAGTGVNQVPLCLKLIEECVTRVKKEPIPVDELQRVKDNFKGTLLMNSDSVEARMYAIARNELFLGEYYSLEEVCRMVDGVTPEDIRRVARKLLRPDRRSLMFLGPSPARSVRQKLGSATPKMLDR